MDYILPIERLVTITLASWEMQLQMIGSSNKRQVRAHSVKMLKQFLQALLKQVNSTEDAFIRDIESENEERLGHSASLAKTLEEANRRMPDVPPLTGLSTLAKAGHRHLTTELASEEVRLIAEVSERFNKMREQISTVFDRLSRIA